MVPKDWEASKPIPIIGIGSWRGYSGDNERALTITILDENGLSVSTTHSIIPPRHAFVTPLPRKNYSFVTYLDMPKQGKYATIQFVLSETESGTIIRESENKINLVEYLVRN